MLLLLPAEHLDPHLSHCSVRRRWTRDDDNRTQCVVVVDHDWVHTYALSVLSQFHAWEHVVVGVVVDDLNGIGRG